MTMSTWRCLALSALTCIGVAGTSVACAHTNSELSGLQRMPDWQWAPPQTFHMPGSRLELKPFSTTQDVVSAAQRLVAAGIPRLDRMWFSPSEVQLSGLWKGKHWLAQLWPAQEGGTTGVLSSLSQRAESSPPFSGLTYLPDGCRSFLHVSTRVMEGREQLLAYRCSGNPPEIMQHVQRALMSAGWQSPERAGEIPALKSSPMPPAQTSIADWQREQWPGRLTLITRRVDHDTAHVIFWLRPEGS